MDLSPDHSNPGKSTKEPLETQQKQEGKMQWNKRDLRALVEISVEHMENPRHGRLSEP